MSIVIHGMKMPKNCGVCFVGDRTICKEHCPLIEIPPHGRLIDADALKIYQMEENVRADGDPNEYEYDAGLIDGLHMADKDVSVAITVIPADPEGGADG